MVAKHAPKVVGPKKVIKVLSPVVLLVEDLQTSKTTKVHAKNLNRFEPPREPAVAQSPPLSDHNEQPR